MEEVDNIILPILRGVGWQAADDVTSVAQFTPELIFGACAAVVARVHPGTAFAPGNKLPAAKAQRFRACTNLSEAISEMGYPGELGYQSFLYPNVKDMRALLIWIADRLPKHEARAGAGAGAGAGTSGAALGTPEERFERQAHAALRAWSQGGGATYNRHVRSGRQSALQPRHAFRALPLSLPSDDGIGEGARRRAAPSATASSGGGGGGARAAAAAARARNPRQEANCKRHHGAPTLRFLSEQLRGPGQAQCLAPSVLERHARQMARAALAEELRSDARSSKERADAVRGMVTDAFVHSQTARGGFGNQTIAEMVRKLMSAYGRGSAGFGREDELEGAFARRAQFGQEAAVAEEPVVAEPEEDLEALRAEREAVLAALRAELAELTSRLAAMVAEQEANVSLLRQMDGEAGDLALQKRRLVDAYKVKKRTLALMENADDNMAKLQELLNASTARLAELAGEWETHRQPLIAELRRLRRALHERKGEVEMKVAQIRRMRAAMKAMVGDVRDRDERAAALAAELERLPKSVNRQVYVRRIMDVVKNLERQKVDIDAVLSDIRRVQRDINTVSETSKRSFMLTDETIYAAASSQTGKKDPTAASAYKQVVLLKEGFDAIVHGVEETGKTKADIRRLTQDVERLEARDNDANMEKVSGDLSAIRAENKVLKKAWKAAARGGGGGGDDDDEA